MTAPLLFTALPHTHSYKFNQGVVDEGSLWQEEAASRTKIMEEKQFLLLSEEQRQYFVSVM